MATPLEIFLDWVVPYSKAPRERLAAMAKALHTIDAEAIEGDVVECGVWRGGNIMLARFLSPARVCWLYDTFEGMTNPSEFDLTRGGWPMAVGKSAVSLADVQNNFRQTATFDVTKLRFVAGAVEETLQDENNLPDRIALLRLDTDWYHSTKAELEVLWPRLAPGGILIVDDYGHWLGCRKAVDEFFRKRVPFQRIDYTAIMAIKPHAQMQK